MYKCLSCGEIFKDPKEYIKVEELSNKETKKEILSCCPYCNCDYEEARQCEICGEYYIDDELYDTTEMINGGCGDCCEQCIENADMISI